MTGASAFTFLPESDRNTDEIASGSVALGLAVQPERHRLCSSSPYHDHCLAGDFSVVAVFPPSQRRRLSAHILMPPSSLLPASRCRLSTSAVSGLAFARTLGWSLQTETIEALSSTPWQSSKFQSLSATANLIPS